MAQVTDLIDEVLDQAAQWFTVSKRAPKLIDARNCDGCGIAKPDVDRWAENSETGEELFLCLACGE